MIRAEIAPAPRRDHWLLICHPERGLVKQRFFQDRSVRRPEGWEIREHFRVLEETLLTTEGAEAWLENLMAENVVERGNLITCKWTVHWNGWQLPRRFSQAPTCRCWLKPCACRWLIPTSTSTTAPQTPLACTAISREAHLDSMQ